MTLPNKDNDTGNHWDVSRDETWHRSCKRAALAWAAMPLLVACGGTEMENARATISAQQNEIDRLRGYLVAQEQTEENLRENFKQLAHTVEEVDEAFIDVRISMDLAAGSSREFAYTDWKIVVPELSSKLELLKGDVDDTHMAIRNARAAAGLTNLFFDPGKRAER
jgi:hypothetical protein